MRRSKDWDFYYEPSQPRRVRGGIKAHSQRGAFGKNWWARRWIAALESLNIGARLGRGRSYARQGQVLDIQVESGAVTARVQGSRARPYRVTIGVRPLSEGEWRRLAGVLGTQVVFTARLLAGEMPPDIEEAFTAAGLSLFPERQADLETDCSCPDWSNPCKHIAAVYYLLGEEFDRDPFLLFQLRGLGRDELLQMLSGAAPLPEDAPEHAPGQPAEPIGQSLSNRSSNPSDPDSAATALPAVAAREAAPLPTDTVAFWQGSGLPPDYSTGDAAVPALTAALPRQLGNFPFWRAGTPLLRWVEPIYVEASHRGLTVLLATTVTDGDEEDANGQEA